MSGSKARTMFYVYSALMGLSLSSILLTFSMPSVARAFFVTAGAFAALSLYGYTTKKDLTTMGRFLSMATIGILVAILVNMFLLKSGLFHLGLSIVVVLVFAGLTAYETQAIKQSYFEGDTEDLQNRKAIFGAFILYGSFVTMFIWMLSIFGSRE